MRIWIWFVVCYWLSQQTSSSCAWPIHTILHLTLSPLFSWTKRTLCCAFSSPRLQSSITITRAEPSQIARQRSRPTQREREYRKNGHPCNWISNLNRCMNKVKKNKTHNAKTLQLAEWKHLSDCGRFVTIFCVSLFTSLLSKFLYAFWIFVFFIHNKHSTYRMAIVVVFVVVLLLTT